ncbi:MAG TPA: hypothetical protein PLP01_03610 [Phycisphaerae bacterium]|nr:hypothetical protein [Phycisphaerae bacterium]
MAEDPRPPYRCIWFYTSYVAAVTVLAGVLPLESIVLRFLVAGGAGLVPFALMAVAWRPQMACGFPAWLRRTMTTSVYWSIVTVVLSLWAAFHWIGFAGR